VTATRQRARPRVGELRPSQLLQTFGVGAVVDLTHLSVTVMGLDDWNTGFAEAVTEERLLAAVRHHLGSQVAALRTPPYLPETSNPFDEWAQVGVPVAVFPRWLRCPRCNLLAPISSGLFTLKTELVRTDRTRYVHTNCSGKGRAPDVLAARFLLACPAGHLDDFPWVEFVHQGASCSGPVLELRETGVSGLAADVQVRCRTCNTPRRMAQAFGEEARGRLPRCRGRHPHLASFGTGCDQPVRTILLGASNAWFAVRLSVLSIPVAAGPLAQKVVERWADLQRITSPEVLAFARGEPKYATFAAYTDAELWAAIEARRSAGGQEADDPADLLGPEWAAFSDPAGAPAGDDFRLRSEAPPSGFAGRIEQVVLAERLREVQALVGFTRVDAPDEPRQGTERMWAPLARSGPLWVPCAEVRGEGVFLRLAEPPLAEWERRVEASDRARAFAEASARWRHARGLPPEPWKGVRFTLLHTLAHVLIREFALERLRRGRAGRTAVCRGDRPGADGGPAAVHGRARLRGCPRRLGRAGRPGPARPAARPGARPCAAVQLRPAVCRARAWRGRLAAWRRLPCLPVRGRDVLSGRQPLPGPVAAGRHPRPRRPGILRP
jgi:hypothetical protein